MIQELIDKSDNFELIRDQIAAILAVEIDQQKAYATAAGKDPAQWDLGVYAERATPWEMALNDPTTRHRPIVNVYFDNMTTDDGASNTVETQTVRTTYHLDCIAFGYSSPAPGGHNAGDRDAALAVQRASRLVRNIIMAGTHTYLGLRGIVGRRMFRSVTVMQPPIDSNTVQAVIASRLALEVRHVEHSPQFIGAPLELISTETTITPSGEIVRADYTYD